MSNQDAISALTRLVEIEINNKTEEILKNLISDSGIENIGKDDLKLALRCVKLSAIYSSQTVLEILHELNLLNLNLTESQDSFERKIEFLSTHRVIKNQKNEE